jgi:hypothetical protein
MRLRSYRKPAAKTPSSLVGVYKVHEQRFGKLDRTKLPGSGLYTDWRHCVCIGTDQCNTPKHRLQTYVRLASGFGIPASCNPFHP